MPGAFEAAVGVRGLVIADVVETSDVTLGYGTWSAVLGVRYLEYGTWS
jgi:hypothetical protein